MIFHPFVVACYLCSDFVWRSNVITKLQQTMRFVKYHQTIKLNYVGWPLFNFLHGFLI